jgi:hypothetical protein
MSEHTEGWTYLGQVEDPYVRNFHEIVQRGRGPIAYVASRQDVPLIAAAPDLLEAAKQALQIMGETRRSQALWEFDEVMTALEDAIAAAERKAPDDS